MNKTESIAIFIERLVAYDLSISKINNETCDGIPPDLYDRIMTEGSLNITFDIDNQPYSIKIAVDEETALVVYDYHEVFDEIAEDIRHYHSIVDDDQQ